MTVEEAIQDLRKRKASIKRDELISLLKSFSFTIKPGRRGDHWVIKHSRLSQFGFWSTDFNGEHGKKPIKKSYITNIIRVLSTYQEHLKELEHE